MKDDHLYHRTPVPNTIEVTMHEFKTHLSQYLMQLRLGNVKGIMIKKYHRPIAFVIDYNPRNLPYPRQPF